MNHIQITNQFQNTYIEDDVDLMGRHRIITDVCVICNITTKVCYVHYNELLGKHAYYCERCSIQHTHGGNS